MARRTIVVFQVLFVVAAIVALIFAFWTLPKPPAPVDARIEAAAASERVVISWTPPARSADDSALDDLAGYRVYFGTASRRYDSVRDAGNVTRFELELAPGRWYFTVAAYDKNGNESAFGEELVVDAGAAK